MPTDPIKNKKVRLIVNGELVTVAFLTDIEAVTKGSIEAKYGKVLNRSNTRHCIGKTFARFSIQRWYKADTDGALFRYLHDNDIEFDLEQYVTVSINVGEIKGIKLTNCLSYNYRLITGSPNDIIGEEITGYATGHSEIDEEAPPPEPDIDPFRINSVLPQRSGPSAYYYNGVTYIAYADSLTKHPYVSAYNHSSNTWVGPVLAGTSTYSSSTYVSNYLACAPAIIVDALGYIHIMYDSNDIFNGIVGDGPQKHSRSTNPEDITAWTPLADIGERHNNPHLVKDKNGNLYMFLLNRQKLIDLGIWYGFGAIECYKSTDNGANWVLQDFYIATRDFIGGTDTYGAVFLDDVEYDYVNDRIYMTWHRLDMIIYHNWNVYAGYYDCADGHMYTVDEVDKGANIMYYNPSYLSMEDFKIVVQDFGYFATSPLTPDDGHQDFISKITIDSVNNVFMAYQVYLDSYTGNETHSNKLYVISWINGIGWSSAVQVGEDNLGHDNPIGVDIRVVSGTGQNAILELYRCEVPAPTDLKRYRSANGGATWENQGIVMTHVFSSICFVSFVDTLTGNNGCNAKIRLVFSEYLTSAPPNAGPNIWAYGDSGSVP